ncbi:MAG: damage-inducible protein DinB [Chloroflexota bacterium]|nr:damage-inducible protein DinB [Chloroflexota bacterium]PLS79349.1 MAG: damage-inducible protein DinB [Chloroflexota bacterium]
MPNLLSELFKHNLWANLRLLDACARLEDAQLERKVAGTYGSLSDTWVHLVAAEGRYVALLSDQQPDQSFSEHTGFLGWADLGERAQHSGERLIALAENFDASRVLRGIRNGESFAIPAVVPMIQAINHATEHRVHIATILTQLGIEPPTLDGWQYGQDHLSAS